LLNHGPRSGGSLDSPTPGLSSRGGGLLDYATAGGCNEQRPNP
jgi:hypothetical protein